MMLRLIALAGLGLMCGATARAEVAGAVPTVSSEVCLLMRIAESVRIHCHEAQAGIMLDSEMPVRLWLPDFGKPSHSDYFLGPAALGSGVMDHVFARLNKTLQYCEQDEDCRQLGRAQRVAASDGCAEPPEVYQPLSVFRYNGEETPMFPAGYVLLCGNTDQILMIWLAPMSMTLRPGGQLSESDMDGFNIAVFPLSD